MYKSDTEYVILDMLKKNPNLTQRQISRTMGLSLGKTNYVVNALINKGWVKLKNFRKSDNKIGYIYLLTPEGVANKKILAKNFLIRKSKEYKRLKAEIEILKQEL